MEVQCHVEGRWVKVLAEALGWSLAPGREGLSGLPHDPKRARSGFAEGLSMYQPYPIGVPDQEPAFLMLFLSKAFQSVPKEESLHLRKVKVTKLQCTTK